MHPTLPLATDILKQLVAFDTTSHKSNLACIDYIENLLQEAGVTAHRLENGDKTKAGIIARLGDEMDGGICLSGHTDVVPVAGQNWETDPFELTDKEDGKLYARGTSDMKGFIACALALLPHFKQHAQKPVHFAFSYDEEVGCLSAPQMAGFLAEQPVRPSLVIVGEPTSMEVMDAHKGVASFITRITGLEGHSSNPEAGMNAVNVGAELVMFLNCLAEEQKAPELLNARFKPPYSTIHVGMLHGGTALNIIPNSCEIAWEVRLTSESSINNILQRFYAFCEQKQKQMQKIHANCMIETQTQSNVPGLMADTENPELPAVLHACGHNRTHAVSYATEAGVFQKHGFHTLICGPGDIAQAHKADEFVEKDQLSRCLAFLQEMFR